MNNILSEKEYQRFIIDRLVKDNGFRERSAKDYDRYFALDRGMLFDFLNTTQKDEIEALRKIYKGDLEETIVGLINSDATKKRGSILNVLKNGIELSNYRLTLMYRQPATTFNKELTEKYNQNIFSVMEEVWASDKERIDIVLFLNGIAIASFELKCNMANQSYQDAIYQYRMERDPKTRLFLFKAGTLVNFAMDLNEVYMTTKLDGDATYFLPFNMGCGIGIDAGKGNPVFDDRYSVSYMWENILKKDTLIELISKFIFIEVKEKTNELTGRTKVTENLIFPRFHQLDVIRKILSDVQQNHSSQNYLIQHSAGSGKTNSITWLAHRLTSLHDADNKQIFDNVVVVTDRVVVDRQLQAALLGIEHKGGLIRVMDEKCSSSDLADALNSNTKIIATTIQKFPYIVDSVKGLENKTFAVIIDEAHSSTSGKDMAAVTKSLGASEDDFTDVQDLMSDEIRRNGKQPNVSIFAFTATPKPTTLMLFGRLNTKGQREAFHIYSMKQAIEEGFILDVLQNYITYDTYYHLNKEIEEDPRCKTSDAKRQIARFVELHDTNILQRVEVIVEHFTEVSINGKPAFTLSCTPNHLKELVVGRLYTERLIGSVDDIAHLFICGEGNIAEVTLKENVEYKPFSGVEPTCCTENRQYVDGVREFAPVSQVSVNPETVFELVNHFSEDGKLHKSTGGTHSCYIHFGDGEVASFEDIGRHNALDKAVGHMLLNNKEAEGCVLFTTGRVAADMVIKTVASGIPVLVSKAVPTTKALSLAKKYGLKLICNAWPDSYLEME